MPGVYEYPFSGATTTLRRLRAATLPPGAPQRAYIDLALPPDRAGKQRVIEGLLGPAWRFVGEGAGRLVYLEPHGYHVLKFAKHPPGARDNLVEAETYRRATGPMLNILAPVTSAAADGLWLEMPYGSEGINGGPEFDAAARAVFSAGLRCTDLKVDSFRKIQGQIRLIDYGQGGCLGGTLWSDDYNPAITTTGTPTGDADLRGFVAALYDPGLRNALTRASTSGSSVDARAAVAELDRLTTRLRAAHAADGPMSALSRLAAAVHAVRSFVDATSTPPYFDADQARRGYARGALRTLDALNNFAVTQTRLPAPTI